VAENLYIKKKIALKSILSNWKMDIFGFDFETTLETVITNGQEAEMFLSLHLGFMLNHSKTTIELMM